MSRSDRSTTALHTPDRTSFDQKAMQLQQKRLCGLKGVSCAPPRLRRRRKFCLLTKRLCENHGVLGTLMASASELCRATHHVIINAVSTAIPKRCCSYCWRAGFDCGHQDSVLQGPGIYWKGTKTSCSTSHKRSNELHWQQRIRVYILRWQPRSHPQNR